MLVMNVTTTGPNAYNQQMCEIAPGVSTGSPRPLINLYARTQGHDSRLGDLIFGGKFVLSVLSTQLVGYVVENWREIRTF